MALSRLAALNFPNVYNGVVPNIALEKVRMSSILSIQEAIRSLPDEEFCEFSSWFEQYEEERWDRQIERDQRSGPLRTIMEKARADSRAGSFTPL